MTTPIRLAALLASVALASGCASAPARAEVADTAVATLDGAADAVPAADAAQSSDVPKDATATADAAEIALPCDETAVVAVYLAKARIHWGNCAMCHGSPGSNWMGKPGPTWFIVDDPLATVRILVHWGMVLQPPESSPLLLKLIPADEGGLPHKGGERMHKGDAMWQDLLDFAASATECAP